MKILDELEKAADAATPGPWTLSGNIDVIKMDNGICTAAIPKIVGDSRFIALANPESIQILCNVIRALMAERQLMIDSWPEPLDADDCKEATKAIAKLKALGRKENEHKNSK